MEEVRSPRNMEGVVALGTWRGLVALGTWRG